MKNEINDGGTSKEISGAPSIPYLVRNRKTGCIHWAFGKGSGKDERWVPFLICGHEKLMSVKRVAYEIVNEWPTCKDCRKYSAGHVVPFVAPEARLRTPSRKCIEPPVQRSDGPRAVERQAFSYLISRSSRLVNAVLSGDVDLWEAIREAMRDEYSQRRQDDGPGPC